MKTAETPEGDVTTKHCLPLIEFTLDCSSVWKYAAVATPPVTGIESRSTDLTLLALLG